MREVKVAELKTLSMLFDMSIDDIINYDENTTPKDVILEDKSENEQIKLINQLDEEDKSTILKIIDTMLTKKKFKDFFNKNIATL
jgi:DNA-directed RNA polymerase sigma subunit (sigma70/sigma32)